MCTSHRALSTTVLIGIKTRYKNTKSRSLKPVTLRYTSGMENLGTHELRNLVNDAADEAVNIGYRVADRLHRWREKRAIAAGREPILVPTEGYGRAASDGNPGWVRVIARALYKTVNLERLLQVVEGTQDTANPMRGWRSFTATAMSDAPVTIVIDGTKHEAYTDRGGVLDVKLSIDLEPGIHEVIMYVPGSRAVATSVYIVPESQKLGVIMDVDDTVMVTMLPRPLVAAWNSFILDEHARIPTPGMAVMTDRIRRSHPNAPFMYLSTGAWNITPTLRRFLSRNGYPRGTFLLTDWGPTPDRWFRSGTNHKVESLRCLAEEFPQMKWILVGDDGQRDPYIYNGFAVRYPDNVAAIVIRNLTVGETMLASGRVWSDYRAEQMMRSPLWIEATDGVTLSKKLRELGLIDF